MNLLKLLLKVEWSLEWCGGYYCPVCEENKKDGHKFGCDMEVWIRKMPIIEAEENDK